MDENHAMRLRLLHTCKTFITERRSTHSNPNIDRIASSMRMQRDSLGTLARLLRRAFSLVVASFSSLESIVQIFSLANAEDTFTSTSSTTEFLQRSDKAFKVWTAKINVDIRKGDFEVSA